LGGEDARVWIDTRKAACDDDHVNTNSHVWGTVVVLTLAIIGVAAGWNVISNHQAKIEVRQQRISHIDADIATTLETTREVVNRRFPVEAVQVSANGTQVGDIKTVNELLAAKKRSFNLCYDNISEWNRQRQMTEAVVFDLLNNQSLYAVLTVTCAVVGLYAAFALQRST
jgi:hypothetical protein